MYLMRLYYLISICIFTGAVVLQLHAEDGGQRVDMRIPTEPVITLNYGQSVLTLKDFEYTFSDPGLLEIGLGFFDRRYFNGNTGIIDYLGRHLTITHISTDIGSGSGSEGLKASFWRFGLSVQDGFGYSLSSPASGTSLLLTHSTGITWVNMDITRPETIPPGELMTDRFEDAVRFGGLTEAGIHLYMSNMFAIQASFERSIIYERHLFWKWVGSVMLEGAAQELIGLFVDRIMETSPTAGPIVNFLLKNSLAYGVYELRKSSMNWPFDTTVPLFFDTFKVGMSFAF
jgi:hypothetical protein